MPATSSPTLLEPPSPAAFNYTALLLVAVSSLSLLVTDHLGMVTPGDFLQGGLLVCMLFFVPDLLAGRSGARWWESTVVWTIILLLLTALAGAFFARRVFAAYLLLAPGTLLLLRGKSRRPPLKGAPVLAGVALGGLCVFVYFSLYGRGYHSWLFTEFATIGGGVLDTYFHAAISESIHQLGVPSTSIDGSPYLQYHWFSHWLLGGLARGVGVNSFVFYHLFYPAIFVPLGLKMLYHFGRTFGPSLAERTDYTLLFVVGAALFFALPLPPLVAGHPFLGESQCLALCLVIAHAILLRRFAARPGTTGGWLTILLASFILGCLLSFTKISTGFVWLGALAPLYVLRVPRRYWWSALLFALIPVLVVSFVLLLDRESASVTLADRINNIFDGAGRLFFLAWVPVMLLVLRPAVPAVSASRSAVRHWGEAPFAPVLVLGAVWVLGCLGALAGSTWPPDVVYFVLPGILLSFPVWLTLVGRVADSLPDRARGWWASLLLLVVVVCTPRIFGGLLLARQSHTEAHQPKRKYLLRRQFIGELHKLSAYSTGAPGRQSTEVFRAGSQGAMIGIEQGQDWFWANGPHELASSFLVPAIAGTPMVAGVSRELLESDYTYYSVANYRKTPFPPVADGRDLLARARKLGYDSVIVFRADGNELKRVIID